MPRRSRAAAATTASRHPRGNGADSTINTLSHEQIESITDPFVTAWYSNGPSQDEMADLCAYDFGTPLADADAALYNQVINGHNYLLQLEYSNVDHGCVPYLDGTVSPPATDLLDGKGPVAYHHGPVMLTSTAYAIYWVPVTPTNRIPPAIAGAAKVGKKLSASHGTWTSVPTKYTYHWFRCSGSGTSCKSIARATSSSHRLVKADAKHHLYVQVTATTVVGTATANSALTRTVKS